MKWFSSNKVIPVSLSVEPVTKIEMLMRGSIPVGLRFYSVNGHHVMMSSGIQDHDYVPPASAAP